MNHFSRSKVSRRSNLNNLIISNRGNSMCQISNNIHHFTLHTGLHPTSDSVRTASRQVLASLVCLTVRRLRVGDIRPQAKDFLRHRPVNSTPRSCPLDQEEHSRVIRHLPRKRLQSQALVKRPAKELSKLPPKSPSQQSSFQVVRQPPLRQ